MVRRKGKFRVKYSHFLELFNELYRNGMKNKVFNEKLDPGLTVEFIIGGIRNLVHKWSLEDDDTDTALYRKNILDLVHKTILV